MTPPDPRPIPTSVDDTVSLLAAGRYVADRSLGTSLYLALKLGRPLLLEGDAGVGKTEVARVLAEQLGRRLIRLQCYEGLDVAAAVYEWNYARQMLEIRLAEVSGHMRETGEAGKADRERLEKDLFSEPFLIRRPLLQALGGEVGSAPVLLIDELDRTDEPFEAYLLELLSDFQVTIPEIGAIRAVAPPIVLLTSNRTREIHDALKRRCFYHFIGYPDAARELSIVRARVPQAPELLTRQIVGVVQRLRSGDLFKLPGVAETLDWTHALLALDRVVIDPESVDSTLGILLKYQDDVARVQGPEARRIVNEVIAETSDAQKKPGF